MESAQIMVVPFHGQGHVFPSVELCKRLAARGVSVTILADPSIASSLHQTATEVHDSQGLTIGVLELKEENEAAAEHHDQEPGPFDHLAKSLEDILQGLVSPPLCIIGDVMVPWVTSVCDKLSIPRVSFFTSGACALAFEYAIWKHSAQVEEAKTPFAVPGFPESMTITPSDGRHSAPPGPPPNGEEKGAPPGPPGHRGRHPPRGRGRGRGRGGRPPPPPPPPGDHGADRPPPWMNGLKECNGALVNTCRELESSFMEYVIKETQRPAWAVGPLLPSSFWEESAGSVTHDSLVRKSQKGSIDEEQCTQWLNARAPGSVLYVSFGSEVGPSDVEWTELELGLEAAGNPFILVLQAGQDEDEEQDEDILPEGFERRVEGRGLVIRGWAPQLLILSHPATGGFLSHCGWNSTVESLGHGVPLLAWPIRGDQHYNAKLLVKELKVAAMMEVDEECGGTVKRDSVVKGVKTLMDSAEGLKMREKAKSVKAVLRCSIESSEKELDAFIVHSLQMPKERDS